MINIPLWDVINSREPKPRGDIPETLEKPENAVGDEAKASEAEDGRDGAEADPSKLGYRD